MLLLILKIIQHEFRNGTSGIGIVSLDHVLQFFDIFPANRIEVYHLAVTMLREHSAYIIYIRDPATHTGCKVATRIAQDHDPSPCHILTTMIAYSFHHGADPGITHGETLAVFTPYKGFTRSGAIEGYVADYAIFFRDKTGILCRIYDEPCARQTFTEIVIGIAFELQRNPTRIEGAKALTRRSGKFEMQGVFFQPLAFIPFRDLIRKDGACCAIGIFNVEFRVYFLPLFQRRFC